MMSLLTNKYLIVFIISMTLISCATFRKNKSVSIEQKETNIEMRLSSPGVSFYFPGDYWFHTAKRSLLPDTDPRFFKSLQQKQLVKPSILFSGHTTIQPYCSSIGLFYDSNESPEKFSKRIVEELKKDLPVSNLSIRKHNASGSIYVLEYFLRHSSLRIQTQHAEYILKEGNQMLRLCFWTKEREPEWLLRESSAIVNSIQRRH